MSAPTKKDTMTALINHDNGSPKERVGDDYVSNNKK